MKAFHFIFHIQGHSMDHGLTFLIICKILYFNFWYYPNLSSLAFKRSVDKQSRVTVSRNFCYYHVLFNSKKLQCIWLSQLVKIFFLCVHCSHWVQIRKCALDFQTRGILCTWFEEWCILFRKPYAIKGSHSILFTQYDLHVINCFAASRPFYTWLDS